MDLALLRAPQHPYRPAMHLWASPRVRTTDGSLWHRGDHFSAVGGAKRSAEWRRIPRNPARTAVADRGKVLTDRLQILENTEKSENFDFSIGHLRHSERVRDPLGLIPSTG